MESIGWTPLERFWNVLDVVRRFLCVQKHTKTKPSEQGRVTLRSSNWYRGGRTSTGVQESTALTVVAETILKHWHHINRLAACFSS